MAKFHVTPAEGCVTVDTDPNSSPWMLRVGASVKLFETKTLRPGKASVTGGGLRRWPGGLCTR